MVSSHKSRGAPDETTDNTSVMAPLKESALAGVGAALGFVALFAASQVLPMLPGDVKIMCPPLGAVAVLLFCLCALLCPPLPFALCNSARTQRTQCTQRTQRTQRTQHTQDTRHTHLCHFCYCKNAFLKKKCLLL